MAHLFVGLPDKPYEKVMLKKANGDNVRQVLWGDILHLKPGENPDGTSKWVKVIWDPNGSADELKIERKHTAKNRPLEIIFVDVGQGDGAVLISPEPGADERIMVIDAGLGSEMLDFLEARFRAVSDGAQFYAAIITHPDKDHYLGFNNIFRAGNITFEHCYHSGLVERPTGGDLGGLGKKKSKGSGANKRGYIDGLVLDDAGMRAIFGNAGSSGRMFSKTIFGAIDNQAVDDFSFLGTSMASVEAGLTDYMPEFEPHNDKGYVIEVLGPVTEEGSNGKPWLRTFPDKLAANAGLTKNGHSVLLRLCYGKFSILFGGDLNREAERFLLTSYGDVEDWPVEPTDRDHMLAMAGARFRSDVMKTCHHGSSDVTDEFLEAVDAAAFVISSGDNEGHVHPRPDLLGRLGRQGRGRSPVLLSTELQRSTRAREDQAIVKRLKREIKKDGRNRPAADLAALEDDIAELGRSNVDVDGAIYLKTDGNRLITAFKKETGADKDKWFWFEYVLVGDTLLLEPRGGH